MIFTKENKSLKFTTHARDTQLIKWGYEHNGRESFEGAIKIHKGNAHKFRNDEGDAIFIKRVKNQAIYTPQQSFYVNYKTDQIFVIDWEKEIIVTTYKLSTARENNKYAGRVAANQHNYRRGQW
jgi:hypothetical protein